MPAHEAREHLRGEVGVLGDAQWLAQLVEAPVSVAVCPGDPLPRGGPFLAFQLSRAGSRCVEVVADLPGLAPPVLIVVCDGLTGLAGIEAVSPDAVVQTCIVHLTRAALRWVDYRTANAWPRSCG